MRNTENPAHWWSWNRPLDRTRYLLVGAGLMLVKFALDWSVSRLGYGLDWKPWSYFTWPHNAGFTAVLIDRNERNLVNALLWISLPFTGIGVLLTWQRLRDAALSQKLIVLFFIPLINWIFFLILCLVPSRPPIPEILGAAERIMEDRGLRRSNRFNKKAAAQAIGLSIPSTVAVVWFGVEVLHDYGAALFLGAPFVLGFLTALFHNSKRDQSVGSCISVATTAVTCVGLVFLVIAFEGVICLLMAAPIAYPLAAFGAIVGYQVSSNGSTGRDRRLVTLALTTAMPALMAAEHASHPEPSLWEVCTIIEIDAPPETVWRNVIAFPPLPEPNDWLFGTGVAYPQRAEIVGEGVGAVRHCIFSTGAFVEPIDVWDAPNVLRFRVTEQPPPMREWSFYDIHPPHLDNYLVSREGEFCLTALPDGKTRLAGTTWYTNRMWPADYWRLWSDFIIHRIHRRVLDHIRERSEGK